MTPLYRGMVFVGGSLIGVSAMSVDGPAFLFAVVGVVLIVFSDLAR